MQPQDTLIQTNRRKYTRVEFHAKARVSQGELSYGAGIVDVSLNGILLETPDTYHIRADLPADILVILGGEATIEMRSRLIHTSNHIQGFRIESIDMESICHLRRLIELNMNDPAAPERVLEELVASR